MNKQEAYDAFCPEDKQGYPAEMVITLSGAELFAQIARLNLDGVVFNCNGPARPIAFASGIAQVVLDSMPEKVC